MMLIDFACFCEALTESTVLSLCHYVINLFFKVGWACCGRGNGKRAQW